MFSLLFAQKDTLKNKQHIWPSRIYFYVNTFLVLIFEFFSTKMFVLQKYILLCLGG